MLLGLYYFIVKNCFLVHESILKQINPCQSCSFKNLSTFDSPKKKHFFSVIRLRLH